MENNNVLSDNISSLLQERLSALDEVKVYGESQAKVLQLSIAALKAHAAGPDAYAAFVKTAQDLGVSLKDSSLQLWAFPQDQTPAAASAIEYLKKIVGHEEYVRILECSERGDKRFSPQYATLNIHGQERNIEELYQTAKRTKDGRCAAEGETVDHIVDPFTGDKLSAKEAPWFYRGLWISYLTQNPELVQYAEQFDAFSNIGSRHVIEKSYHVCIEAYVKGNRQRYVDVVKCSDWYKNMARKLKRPLSNQIFDASNRASNNTDRSEHTSHENMVVR